MRVSIVIPNFNGKENLLKNLPKVLETGAEEIIVVDDASTDESVLSIKYYVSSIKKGTTKIKILENHKNLGFSSTVNRGVEKASGEIVVLLNTDVCPEKDFLKSLLSHFNDPQVFAVGCLDKSEENGKVILRGRGIGQWQRGFLVHERGEINETDTLWVSGGSGAFKKDLWIKLGGMDPLFNPFYWEDIDLSYRAQKSGFKVLFESKSQVTHQHEEGIIKKKFSPFEVMSIAYRNQFFFVWKNITQSKLIFSHLFWLPYHFLKALLRFDGSFFYGFCLAIIRLPTVFKSRSKVQKLFTKRDEEIFNH